MTPSIWADADKDKMRTTAESHMADSGYRLVRTVTIGDTGEPIETWTQAQNPTICGVETLEGREYKDRIVTTTYEMVLRFPVDFEILPEDRFLITSHRGDTVSWEYEMTTPIRAGISANRVGVRRIEH